jgi:uncharacterized integral membrane protein
MQVFLLLALLVAALAVIFAVQNTEIVTVDFLAWSFQGSLALILLIALASGAIASSLASIPSMFRVHRLGGAQRRNIENLQAEIVKLKQELEHHKPPKSPPPAESGRDQLA